MKKPKNNQNDMAVDYLIIGTGNIALRHLTNITNKSNNKVIAVYKRFKNKLNNKFKEKGTHIISNLDNIFPKTNKAIAVICSAASMHINDAEHVAKKGFNILLEKPLTIPGVRTRKLLTLCKDQKLKTLVGYNMRFMNRINSVLNIIDNNDHGSIKEVEISVDTDFRKWRKNLNYKKTVSFNKNLGGGVINELSHEVDYLNLLFGKPKTVIVNNKNTNSYNNIETHINAIFKYAKKYPSIKMNLNMLSSETSRYCKIHYDNLFIKIDHIKNSILIRNSKQKKIKIFKDTLNDSYIKELNNLIKSIKNNTSSKLSIEKCIDTQNIINAMHKSIKSNKKELIL